MSGSSFKLNIVTPAGIFSRDISHLRLKDESGFLGIMKGHIDFLTVLVPSLCYYRDENGKEMFLAVDEGIFSVRGGVATLTSREIFESEDAEKLAELMESTFEQRRKAEEGLREMLGNIEKSFIEKTVVFLRELS
jgi:F-type H+-transporting ATPase subunit epsilon